MRKKKREGFSPEKPLSEQETRARFLSLAKDLGCEQDLIKIFNRYDGLLRRCTNPTERQQISIMANVEVHRLFNFQDALVVGGQEILPGMGQNGKTTL